MTNNIETDNLIEWLKSDKSIDLQDFAKTIKTFEPSFNLANALDSYFVILAYSLNEKISDNLHGLEQSKLKAINACIYQKTYSIDSTGVFCKSFEAYIKKVFRILQENEFITPNDKLQASESIAIAQYLKRLNRAKKKWKNNAGAEAYYCSSPGVDWRPILNNEVATTVSIYDRKTRFDEYPNIQIFDTSFNHSKESFEYFFVRAYLLKNEQSHQVPDKPTYQLVQDFKCTFVTELHIAHFFHREIIESNKKSTFNKVEFGNFISNEIIKFTNKVNKYVSLNLRDITSASSSYFGFIEDVLEKYNGKIRILGNGGTGKTTTLEYLVYKDLKNFQNNDGESEIPIFLSMGTVPHDITVIEFIARKLNVSDSIVEELFETNRFKLYVDGINEILKNSDFKRRKIQEINSLLENYPNLFIVVTDRYEFDEYQSNMFNLPTFLLQKLTDDQVQQFISKYCANDTIEIQRVKSIIDKKKSINEILSRPLMLSRAIEIIKQENDLPEREGKIIEKFIDILLLREKNEKKDPNLRIKDFKTSLAYVASFIWSKYKSNYAINDFEFLRLLRECQLKFGMEQENFSYIARIALELEIISKEDDKIQFFHQSYLEFFCSFSLKFIDYE